MFSFFNTANKPQESGQLLETAAGRPAAYNDAMATITHELKVINAHFQDLATLRKWENLQPTVRARALLRTLTGYEEAPVQKTVENIPGYKWSSGAYTTQNFDKVIAFYSQEIEKAEELYHNIIGIYRQLPPEQRQSPANLALIKLARETFRTISFSITGLHNWKTKLATVFGNQEEEILHRFTAIDQLMKKELAITSRIYESTLKQFEDMEALFKLSEAIKLEEVDFGKESRDECVEKIIHNNIQLISRQQGATLKADTEHQLVLAPQGTKLTSEESTKVIDALVFTFSAAKESIIKTQANIDLENLNQEAVTEYVDSFQNLFNLHLGLEESGEEISRSLNGENAVWVDETIMELSSLVSTQRNFFEELLQKRPPELADIPAIRPFSSLTHADTINRLDAYLVLIGPNLPIGRVRKMIQEGKEIYQHVLQGELHSPDQHPLGSDHVIIRLSWFLMSIAIKMGQGHSSGSFVIEDKEQVLYKFLERASKCGDRISSHFQGRGPMNAAGSLHKGIDFLRGLGPSGKGHLLFGLVDSPDWINENSPPEKATFLKLEAFSPFITTNGGYDCAMHTYEWAKMNAERKIFKGKEDALSLAKERVPHNLLKAFENIVRSIENDAVFKKNLENIQPLVAPPSLKMAKLWGVSYIHRFWTELGTNFAAASDGASNHEEIFDKWNELGRCMPMSEGTRQLQHLDRRTGREVYLSLQNIEKLVLQN
ncbi:hypothetical protein [Estrella lausannensis]|uniref:Uncharacterized protein n=1 Tax=Estrella lausannensis TaxID=483423 RepID=A0A0H5DQ78_9BACT|nr:hypothetical protein [Estrella lausannensis]CRX38791.1 hypothetical protein ELAC_1455 [Estrella lausannensis]